jgi:hypothetical protein
VKSMLEEHGFTDVTRTVKGTELHIRAVKTALKPGDKAMLLHPDNNTSWYLKYNS